MGHQRQHPRQLSSPGELRQPESHRDTRPQRDPQHQPLARPLAELPQQLAVRVAQCGHHLCTHRKPSAGIAQPDHMEPQLRRQHAHHLPMGLQPLYRLPRLQQTWLCRRDAQHRRDAVERPAVSQLPARQGTHRHAPVVRHPEPAVQLHPHHQCQWLERPRGQRHHLIRHAPRQLSTQPLRWS